MPASRLVAPQPQGIQRTLPHALGTALGASRVNTPTTTRRRTERRNLTGTNQRRDLGRPPTSNSLRSRYESARVSRPRLPFVSAADDEGCSESEAATTTLPYASQQCRQHPLGSTAVKGQKSGFSNTDTDVRYGRRERDGRTVPLAVRADVTLCGFTTSVRKQTKPPQEDGRMV